MMMMMMMMISSSSLGYMKLLACNCNTIYSHWPNVYYFLPAHIQCSNYTRDAYFMEMCRGIFVKYLLPDGYWW